jgi:hypothetical protein
MLFACAHGVEMLYRGKVVRVALAPELVPVLFEPAWDKVNALGNAEETIERVLRRELTHIFTRLSRQHRGVTSLRSR